MNKRTDSVRNQIEVSFSEAILLELERRDLLDPEALSEALRLAPIKVNGLLEHRDWGIDSSIAIIDRLNLRLAIAVSIEAD